jgi:hypothetical protein
MHHKDTEPEITNSTYGIQKQFLAVYNISPIENQKILNPYSLLEIHTVVVEGRFSV